MFQNGPPQMRQHRWLINKISGFFIKDAKDIEGKNQELRKIKSEKKAMFNAK
jgi:ATP-dependent protease ClpP protease subunit